MPSTASPGFIAPMQEALQGLGGAVSKRFQQALPGYQQQLQQLVSGMQGVNRYALRSATQGVPWGDVQKGAMAAANTMLPRVDPSDPYGTAGAFAMPAMGMVGDILPAAFSPILEGTQVLNKRGLPRRVYHGTKSQFGEFSMEHAKPALAGPGIYLTENPYISGGGGNNTHSPLGYSTVPERLSNRVNELYVEHDAIENELRNQRAGMIRYINSFPPGQLPYEKRMQMIDAFTHSDEYLRWEAMLKQAKNELAELEPHTHPNVHAAYLAAKQPFNLDRNLSRIDQARFGSALQAMEQTMPDGFPPDWTASTIRLDPGERGALTRGPMPDRSTDIGNALHRGLANNEFPRLHPDIFSNGWDLYNSLRDEIGDYEASALFSDMGHDAFTHLGGARSGQPPHRVWITWDPKNIVPAWGPKVAR